MGQEATGFHRENKIRRSRLPPIIEGGLCGKAIEAAVQLDCVEPLRVKLEHFICGDLLWVKTSLPVFVVVSGCANANLTRHERRNFLSLCCGTFFCAWPQTRLAYPERCVQILANVRLCVFFLR